MAKPKHLPFYLMRDHDNAVSAEQDRVPDLVSSKTEGTKLGLEVPDHHAAIQATRYELFHVVVEGNRSDCILVTPKGPLQGRVFGLCAQAHKVCCTAWDSFAMQLHVQYLPHLCSQMTHDSSVSVRLARSQASAHAWQAKGHHN